MNKHGKVTQADVATTEDSHEQMIAKLEELVGLLKSKDKNSLHQLVIFYQVPHADGDGWNIFSSAMLCPHPICQAAILEAAGFGLDQLLEAKVMAMGPPLAPGAKGH